MSEFFLDETRNLYAEEWKVTSSFYHAKGYYDVLCPNLSSNSRILEIGCGTGHSTLSIAKKFETVVSVDENIYCIQQTIAFLKQLNIQADGIQRGESILNDDNFSYKMNYSSISHSINSHVTCIEGDVINDNKLIQFLSVQEKFDVITCWMIGAHGLILNEEKQRLKGHNVLNRTASMVRDYKFDVLKHAVKLGFQILSENGFIHIIERISGDALLRFAPSEIFKIYEDELVPLGVKLDGTERIIPIETFSEMEMVSDYNTDTSKMCLVDMKFVPTIDLK